MLSEQRGTRQVAFPTHSVRSRSQESTKIGTHRCKHAAYKHECSSCQQRTLDYYGQPRPDRSGPGARLRAPTLCTWGPSTDKHTLAANDQNFKGNDKSRLQNSFGAPAECAWQCGICRKSKPALLVQFYATECFRCLSHRQNQIAVDTAPDETCLLLALSIVMLLTPLCVRVLTINTGVQSRLGGRRRSLQPAPT